MGGGKSNRCDGVEMGAGGGVLEKSEWGGAGGTEGRLMGLGCVGSCLPGKYCAFCSG